MRLSVSLVLNENSKLSCPVTCMFPLLLRRPRLKNILHSVQHVPMRMQRRDESSRQGLVTMIISSYNINHTKFEEPIGVTFLDSLYIALEEDSHFPQLLRSLILD